MWFSILNANSICLAGTLPGINLSNEKRLIVTFLFLLAGLTYFYPVVKYSKTKLDCESIAKNYILENKNLETINRKQLGMLSTNFCNGGNEIFEIDTLNDWFNYLLPNKSMIVIYKIWFKFLK